jgi:hypothetical protein
LQVSSEAMREVAGLAEELFGKIKNVKGLVNTVEISPIYRSMVGAMKNRGGNSLGLDKWNEPLISVTGSLMWTDESEDALAETAIKEFIVAVEDATRKLGVYHPYNYLNYAAPWQADHMWAGIGKDKLAALKELQRELDPRQVYTQGGLSSGCFLLNKKTEEVKKDEL